MVNETLPIIPQGIVNTINLIFGTVKVMVGGLFGIAVMVAIFKFFELRALKRIIREIRQDTKVIDGRIIKLEKKIEEWKKQKKK